MIKKIVQIVCVVSLLLVAGCAEKKTGSGNTKKERLETLFTRLYKQGKFNGNVLVAEKGTVVFEKSYGLANEKTQQPLNLDTQFELASVSKQFTAMGIVLLKKENKLSYHDEISKYLPELAFYKGITIHHLLVHTSGLPDYMELAAAYWDQSKIAANDDIIGLFEKYHPALEFEPGEKWSYDNTGYMLLATIIERVSGQSFAAFLKEKIFTPLNMKHTTIYRRWYCPEEKANYAQGYIYSDYLQSKVLPHESGTDRQSVYLDGIVGDGMVNSTVHDLLKWDQALYGDALIDETDKEVVFSSYQLADGSETNYGYGWKISKRKKYGRLASHSGGWAGYVSYIERHMDHDKTIILLQNNALSATEIPTRDVCKILYNQTVERAVEVDGAILQQYVGIYVDKSDKEYEIDFLEHQLFFILNTDVQLKLIPVSESKFILDGAVPEVSFTFRQNSQEQVMECRFMQVENEVDKVLIRKKAEMHL